MAGLAADRGDVVGDAGGADGAELAGDAERGDEPDDDGDPPPVHPASASRQARTAPAPAVPRVLTTITRRVFRAHLKASLWGMTSAWLGQSGAVTTSTAADDGHRRAAELVRLLDHDESAAERLLAELTEIRELVFLGAGLTALARSEARPLPPAQRAQANTRQANLGLLRDASRSDPEGLRTWVRRAADEVRFLRSLQAAAAARVAADAPGRPRPGA